MSETAGMNLLYLMSQKLSSWMMCQYAGFLIWLSFGSKAAQLPYLADYVPSLSVIVHLLDSACFVRLVAYFTNTEKEVNAH